MQFYTPATFFHHIIVTYRNQYKTKLTSNVTKMKLVPISYLRKFFDITANTYKIATWVKNNLRSYVANLITSPY